MEIKDEIDGMLGAGEDNINIDSIISPDISTEVIVPPVVDDNNISASESDVEALRKQFADSVSAADESIVVTNPLDKFKDDIEFMKQVDLDGLADNPALLNVAFNQVRRQTAEALLDAFPQLINQAIQAHQVKQDIHNTFYNEHKELVPYKNFVVTIAKEIGEKMKDKPASEVLAAIAKNAKERLKLPISVTPTPVNGVKPALRDSKGSARTGSQQSSGGSTAQSQIADMLGL